MSSAADHSQEELAQARQRIPEINNLCVAEMRALSSVLENNARDFKALVQNFEAITNENTERERVGAVIFQAEYREFMTHVIRELKLRRTVFAGWFMATTSLMMRPNTLALEREVVCMALQKFVVTDEIGQILIDALGMSRTLHASTAAAAAAEHEATINLRNQALRSLAHQLMLQMHKQVEPRRAPITNLYSLLSDGCGTACSCGQDFGDVVGLITSNGGEDNAAAMVTADRDLEAFMARKKLESSDSIVQRPSSPDDETPPKIAARSKKRKTNK